MSVHRTIKSVSQITVQSDQIMTMSIKLKSAKLSKNRNYSFFSKKNRLFDSKKNFFAHVINANVIAVQVQNISTKSMIISKNFEVGHLCDYFEEGCFLTASKNYHLIITSVQKLDLKHEIKKAAINKSKMKMVLFNGITIFGDKKTANRLTVATKKTSKISCLISKMINISSER